MVYTVYADGNILHSYAAGDASRIALKPRLELDTNGAGSLSFVLPPGHALHGSLKRLKTIVSVEREGEEIFYGRVMDYEGDMFNQISVTCEGAISFLRDSLYESAVFDGSAQQLFRDLIANHNSQVEESKRFTVGSITAVDAQTAIDEEIKVETRKFWNTQTVINDRLVNVYGGYLKTRKVGNTRYIDWVKEYGGTSSQQIKFAVNLLDLKNKISGEDVFTVLLPLGFSEMGEDGKYTDPVTVASVNGGVEYIQDDAGVALHGKIWRTKTWGQTKEPAKLLEKAKEYLKTGGAFQSLTLRAIDMHIIDGSTSAINVGDKVRIVSDPHGVNLLMVCSKMVVDLVDPEKSEYTFGEKPRTLTEGVASTKNNVGKLTGGGGGGGRKSLEEEVQDIIRWAEINVSKANAQILLSAGEIDNLKERTSEAEIAIDGANAQITLAASRMDDLEQRTSSAEIAIDGVEADIRLHAESISDLEGLMTQAEIDIDGLEAEITLRASKKSVDDLASRVSQAEIDIDGANAAIKLKASQTTVDNLTKRVSAAEVDIDGANAAIKLHAGSIEDLEGLMTQAEIDIDGLNAEITLKVSKDGVVSAINQTAEEVLIKASKINLSGYVTASQLSAEIADINLNMANTVATDTLRASSAIISFLTFQDTYCTLKSGNFVTSVTFPVYQEANLYYLDWDGNKQSKLVLTPTKNTVGSYAKNKDYKYIGA